MLKPTFLRVLHRKHWTFQHSFRMMSLENGFGSVTAYGKDDFLIDNPIDRYCINDRSVLNRNADGSVDVTLSHVMPENTENWLPIGETDFHLFLRIYKPDWNALRSWQPPTVCVKSTQI